MTRNDQNYYSRNLAIQEKFVSLQTNQMNVSPYRPRNAGHDYYGRGTYLITLVVSGCERLLSRFVNHPVMVDLGHNALSSRQLLMLTPLGEATQKAWLQIPALQSAHGNHVEVHACVCMPDHFHSVIEVLESMSWSLGDIIQAFKAFCTSWWQQEQGLAASIPTSPSWSSA